MKVPEIFHHFEYFTKEDFKLFGKYLKSPYFNTINAYSDIYEIILKNLKYINLRDYRGLRDIIIKSQICSESTTLKLLSNLSDFVLGYFKQRALEKETFIGELHLCESLLSKGYFNALHKRILLCQDSIITEDKFDEDVYLNYFQLDYLKYRISMLTDSKFHGEQAITDQQELTLDSSKNLFVFSLVRITINYLNYVIQNVDTSNKNPTHYPVELEPMFGIIKSKDFDLYDKYQKALILLYNTLFLAFRNLNNDTAYVNYKTNFLRIKNLFNESFSKTHYSILMNYCNIRQRLNDKDLKYGIEGAKVLNDYIREEMYKDEVNQYLPPIYYRNFIIKCNTAESKKILKEFIEEQTKKLHEVHYEDLSNFGYAHYYYLNNEYGKAFKRINNLKNTQFMYKYDIRNLELKIHYEKENYEWMESILHNYQETIKKENIFTQNDKTRYKLQVYYLKKLNNTREKYKLNGKIIEVEHLKNKIITELNFVMKKWMLEKIDELITKHYEDKK